MAQYKKKQLISMVLTLQKANNSVRVGDEVVQEEMREMLSQCQEFAIVLGTELETRGEIGEEITRLLEEYCELVYQQSLVLNNDKECKKYSKNIKILLTKVSNLIKFELPEDKKEIVFFPYKASMWDSLESIWLAVKDDENLDVYVVPIPYYDKNPDGSLGEMHYEGNQYPEYVPITSWNEYLVSERQPDVAFIHNPYDDWNSVTSVHPDYYARELKKYVEELVYVPYFVLAGMNPDNRKAIDKMKHFASLPGVIFSDKVIVQSEKMKQIYVDEYLKFAKEQELQGEHINKKCLESKILGLGSPKIDKIRNVKNIEIPDEWNTKIYRSDGTRKKVIFFNTNLSLILNNNEYFVDNLKRIADIIESHSNDYVLLWREHPLTMETFKSMRPQLKREYILFREEISNKEWVIIDTNPEGHLAMAISNCYYGAGGSLAVVYSFTGKPILLTNYFYPTGMANEDISLDDIFKSLEGGLYFKEWYRNSLALYLENLEIICTKQEEIMKQRMEIGEQNIGKKIAEALHII